MQKELRDRIDILMNENSGFKTQLEKLETEASTQATNAASECKQQVSALQSTNEALLRSTKESIQQTAEWNTKFQVKATESKEQIADLRERNMALVNQVSSCSTVDTDALQVENSNLKQQLEASNALELQNEELKQHVEAAKAHCAAREGDIASEELIDTLEIENAQIKRRAKQMQEEHDSALEELKRTHTAATAKHAHELALAVKQTTQAVEDGLINENDVHSLGAQLQLRDEKMSAAAELCEKAKQMLVSETKQVLNQAKQEAEVFVRKQVEDCAAERQHAQAHALDAASRAAERIQALELQNAALQQHEGSQTKQPGDASESAAVLAEQAEAEAEAAIAVAAAEAEAELAATMDDVN